MRIGKYEFDTKEQAKTKIDALGTAIDENGNEYPTHKHAIVELGNIVLEQGIYDEDGNTLEEPVLSSKWHVDVLWQGLEEHPYGWKSYSVDLDSDGSHSFLGLDYKQNKI